MGKKRKTRMSLERAKPNPISNLAWSFVRKQQTELRKEKLTRKPKVYLRMDSGLGGWYE